MARNNYRFIEEDNGIYYYKVTPKKKRTRTAKPKETRGVVRSIMSLYDVI
jgi:hypothetical protein